MSSIGKITSSLLSIPAELTVAAANLNFDFSLVKVEAPNEFHGVRDALSKARRDKAESGLSHITARKLGALFEQLVPPIPNLLSAYGQRVSEISSKISIDHSSASSTGFGIFSSQAGPDATSIWAAATSGKGAMAVQLLACMLARIWNEPQAISLWVELVERRRIEVNGSTAEGSNVAALMAAQQTFNREQLATWDSSARSWIKTADAQMRLQQTQLLLIISNIDLPVNSSSDLYDSVIKAWTSAMMAMEKLVQGIPQQIRDGATLLAISSWHLYPDMAVLSEVMTRVEQNDPLMNGSLLTFSVHISSAAEDSAGVFWSLPMEHMRYYSPPVVARGRLTSDTARVSMDEFIIVVLGMVVSPWLHTFCPDVSRCCRLVRLLWSLVKDLPVADSPHLNWFMMLSEAANSYLSATGILSQQYSKLLALGIRSRSEFLGEDMPQEPAFGLTGFGTILSLITDEMLEEKIRLLRQIAQSLNPDSEDLIIKYNPLNHWQWDSKNDKSPDKGSDTNSEPNSPETREQLPRIEEIYMEHDSDLSCPALDSPSYEFASAVPIRRTARKRSADGTAQSGEGHNRWVVGRRYEEADRSRISCSGNDCDCVIEGGEACVCAVFNTMGCSQVCHPKSLKCRKFQSHEEDPTIHEEFPTIHATAEKCPLDCPMCHNSTQKDRIQALGEELRWCRQDESYRSADYFQWEDTQNGGDSTLYTFVLGNAASCGIYKSQYCQIRRKPCSRTGEFRATIDELESILRSPIVTSGLLYVSLQCWFRKASIGKSLTAMVFASTLYQALPGATVSLEVLNTPLPRACWSQWSHPAFGHLPTLFSCLAMFESGHFDISPSSLEGVMAMSSYDSIFVASALMRDPSEKILHQPIKRVFGNMGRSEMAFMIPPEDPRFKAGDPGSWHLINHCPFDGQFLDSFQSTSLHLSLTDFEFPLDVGARGLRDRQAVLLEAVITVNDKGVDLGDLDILSALNSDLVIQAGPCAHELEAKENQEDSSSPSVSKDGAPESPRRLPENPTSLISLDCWDELLDPPAISKSIFRATGNWQARLAATAACRQRGSRVRVLPTKPCVLCIGSVEDLDKVDVLIA